MNFAEMMELRDNSEELLWLYFDSVKMLKNCKTANESLKGADNGGKR